MATMVDNLRALISPALVSVVSLQMAESEVAISKGLGAATTAIVSTVANRVDEPGFMNNLADLAAKSAAGSHPLDAIAAPLALGYLGRLMRSENLTVSGLADLLRGERAELTRSLPAGFRMPGIGAPYETGRRAVKERAARGWALPLMA